MVTSILKTEPQTDNYENLLAEKSQINSKERDEKAFCEDLIVPEINRALYQEFSAEKDCDNTQTHYTDTTSSLQNSSLKSSLGQKCLSQDIEENEESEETQTQIQHRLQSAKMAPGALFQTELSPKVLKNSQEVIFPIVMNREFEEKGGPDQFQLGSKTLRDRQYFKPFRTVKKSIWLLKDDTSVSFEVGCVLM